MPDRTEKLIKDLRRELEKPLTSNTSSLAIGHSRFNRKLLDIIDKYSKSA